MDRRITEPLKQDGHEVQYVADLSPSASDEDVLALANQLEAVVITEDKDFGDLVFLRMRSALAVILIRLNDLWPENKAVLVMSLIRQHGEELLGNFSVIDMGGVRIRGMYLDDT